MHTAPLITTANRRNAILIEVANALRAAGSDITNIQTVIAATTVSPQEIVDEFGDLGRFMIALVEALATSMLEPLDDCSTEASFQQKLLAFGNRVTGEHVAPQLKCLYRIALTEVIRNTGVGLSFYKHGLGLVTTELARFFRGSQAAGIVLEEDSRHSCGLVIEVRKRHTGVGTQRHVRVLLDRPAGQLEWQRELGAVRGRVDRDP